MPDVLIVIVYFGILFYISSRRPGEDEILAGRKMGLPMVLFSLLATEISAASLLVYPDLGYSPAFRFNLLSLLAGFFLGRLIIARYFISPLYESGVTSIYEYLRIKSGERAYRLFSWFYLVATPLAAGVRLFIAALGIYSLYAAFGQDGKWPIAGIIMVTGTVGLAYSLKGGLVAVMKTDFLQFILILAGTIALVVFLTIQIFQGHGQWVAVGMDGFWKINHISGFFHSVENYHFPLSFLGGLTVVLGSHSIDQTNLQRILASSGIQNARKAMMLSGFWIVPVTLFFLFAGYVIHGYNPAIPAGEKILPYIIYQNRSGWGAWFRPVVLLIFLSAALSSIDSTLHAMATVIHRLRNSPLRNFRHYAGISGLMLILTALAFLEIHAAAPESPLISLALGITGMFFTPMAAVLAFLVLRKSACVIQEKNLLLAVLPGVLINIVIFVYNYLYAPLQNPSPPLFSWVLGNIFSFLLPVALLWIWGRIFPADGWISPESLPTHAGVLRKLLQGASHHGKTITLVPLKKEVSSRQYFRLEDSGMVVGVYPCEHRISTLAEMDKNEKTSQFLSRHGLPVSRILDRRDNLMLLSDEGKTDLADFLAGNPSVAHGEHLRFYSAAIDWIIRLQSLSHAEHSGEITIEFTPEIYRKEVEIFLREWENGNGDSHHIKKDYILPDIYTYIDKMIPIGGLVLNHRDFHARNILVWPEEIRISVIDYQDLRWGNRWYDLVSLVYDPYVSLSPVDRENLIRVYLERSLLPLNPEDTEVFTATGIQRMIKAAGTYLVQIHQQGREEFREPLRNALANVEWIRKESGILGRVF